ncbi:hypothetical protein CEP54_014212 [Fusarium duplospermum]|uniref:Uncharacterized protein n=1 Tax=Fusarium duplospermum TaxID=1325734 RepID=A0A428NXY7_9HYPO|nr:hypothetical protein CEP54_014212 [Fusarium duplospermum]
MTKDGKHVKTAAVPPPSGQKRGGKKTVFRSKFNSLARRWRSALRDASASQTPAQPAFASSPGSIASPAGSQQSPFDLTSSALVVASQGITPSRRGAANPGVSPFQFNQLVQATGMAMNQLASESRDTRSVIDRLVTGQEQARQDQNRSNETLVLALSQLASALRDRRHSRSRSRSRSPSEATVSRRDSRRSRSPRRRE